MTTTPSYLPPFLGHVARLFSMERLATALGVAPRTAQRWIDGSRSPQDPADVLRRTRQFLVDQRQESARLIRVARLIEERGDALR